MKSAILTLHALSPLHAGTGQSDGAVDLAIARDRASGFPIVPGSSIKGVLRDAARSHLDPNTTCALFGPETANASEHAGSLCFDDAHLLFLPARSMAGTFAWLTSPHLLRRYLRDLALVNGKVPTFKAPKEISQAWVTTDCALFAKGNTILLEDLDLQGINDYDHDDLLAHLGQVLFPQQPKWLRQRFCLVHDDVMAFFSQHALDITTRISINDESKTVTRGALWTEENLPAETILYGLVAAQPTAYVQKHSSVVSAAEALLKLKTLLSTPLHFGGNTTVGRGRTQVRCH